MADYVFDLDNSAKVDNQPKSIYAGDSYNGQPTMTASDEGIFLAGSTKQSVSITDEFGTQISGKISFAASPDQISIAGGYWRLNPMLLSCLPSTSATPIPVLIKANPDLLSSSSDMQSCLGFLGDNGL